MGIGQIANRESGRQHSAGIMVGEVDSWDPSTHSAKVRFPTEVDKDGSPRISGWAPKGEPSAGANGSDATGATPGDMVVVAYVEGNPETPVIVAALHNDQDRPPGVESGERRISAHGSSVFLAKDGSLTLKCKAGSTVSLDKNGGLSMTTAGGSSTSHGSDGSIVHTDGAGGVIRQAGGKVYLGAANASIPVMLETGPSSTIFGV